MRMVCINYPRTFPKINKILDCMTCFLITDLYREIDHFDIVSIRHNPSMNNKCLQNRQTGQPNSHQREFVFVRVEQHQKFAKTIIQFTDALRVVHTSACVVQIHKWPCLISRALHLLFACQHCFACQMFNLSQHKFPPFP